MMNHKHSYYKIRSMDLNFIGNNKEAAMKGRLNENARANHKVYTTFN
jgi:hypothetical protein